jgi:hypothetical protein
MQFLRFVIFYKQYSNDASKQASNSIHCNYPATNVMALRTKIQTFYRKQDFNIQMHIKAYLDIWNSTMVMC